MSLSTRSLRTPRTLALGASFVALAALLPLDVGCNCSPDEDPLLVSANLVLDGTGPMCVAETQRYLAYWDPSAPRPAMSQIEVEVSDSGLAYVLEDGVLEHQGSAAELSITCVRAGTHMVSVEGYEETAEGRRVFGTRTLTIRCELCDDGGMRDGGAADGGGGGIRPAEGFGGTLLMDRRDDHVDSSGPGSVGYTGAEVDVVAMGSEVEMQSLADADIDFNNSTYECGESAGAMFTVCTPAPLDMPGGDLVTFVLDVGERVPSADPTWSYIYALVLDSNGDPADDYVPDPAFPFDYFRGTDRWYELRWDAATAAWSLVVTQLDSASARANVESTARVVVEGARVTFFVSRTELPALVAGFRVSAFRHDGSFTVDTRGGDTSLTPVLPLLPAGCGFLGAECRNDALDRGRAGALESCGAEHECVLEIASGTFNGTCMSSTAATCGPGASPCAAGLTCAQPSPELLGRCLDEPQLDCLCATESGRRIYGICASR